MIKGISKTIRNESKEQKGELLSTLLVTLGNLTQDGNANTTMFFIIEEVTETIRDFSQGTAGAL